MQRDDFFLIYENAALEDLDPEFNRALVVAIRRGPVEAFGDVEVALGLTDLVHAELEAYGTSGATTVNEEDIALLITALGAVLRRLAMADFALPYRNFTTFRSYWIREGAGGSWQARRDLLAQLFDPLFTRLLRMEEASFDALAQPASARASTGWPAVDDEVKELRRRFQSSITPQDYRAVGTHCVGVLEALSRTAFDPAKHLQAGEMEPPVDRSKDRLGRYVEVNLGGKANEELRGLVNKAIVFAHSVKHSTTPSRRDAGIAADAVILLANILRRLEQE